MTIDLGLFYSKETISSRLVGYTNVRYKSDPKKARSQINYLFCYNDTVIYWCSTKKTLVATSTNHSNIIYFYEAGNE